MSQEKDQQHSVHGSQEHSLSKGESPIMDIEKEGQLDTKQQPVPQEKTEATSVSVEGTAGTGQQRDTSAQPEESKKDLNDQPLPTADKKPYVDYDPALIDKQHDEIRAEIEKDSPLISDLLPLEMLEFEFKGHEGFSKKLPVSNPISTLL